MSEENDTVNGLMQYSSTSDIDHLGLSMDTRL